MFVFSVGGFCFLNWWFCLAGGGGVVMDVGVWVCGCLGRD